MQKINVNDKKVTLTHFKNYSGAPKIHGEISINFSSKIQSNCQKINRFVWGIFLFFDDDDENGRAN